MIEALIKYQQKDAELREIEVELSKSEDRKKAVMAKKFLEGADETIAKLEARASELYVAFENANKELTALKEQEDEFKSAKEEAKDENGLAYLIKKTDEILNKIKVLSSDVNRISNEIVNVLKEYSNLRKNIVTAQNQYHEFGSKYNELKASKKGKMEEIEKELAVLKKDVEPALMEKYLKKRADKMFPIFVPLNGKVCGACNMELATSEISKINNGEIIECEFCRKLLYKA